MDDTYEERQKKRDREREEERQLDRRKAALARAETATLCAELEEILRNPTFDIPTLERQAVLLDCLLYTVMRRNLQRDKKNGRLDESSLEFPLRIQKQCVDTLKAAAAIDYMDSVRSLSTGIYPARLAPPVPPPPKHEERTIKFELSDGSQVEL